MYMYVCMYIYIYGGFHKWGHPKIDGLFHEKSHLEWMISGYHHPMVMVEAN